MLDKMHIPNLVLIRALTSISADVASADLCTHRPFRPQFGCLDAVKLLFVCSVTELSSGPTAVAAGAAAASGAAVQELHRARRRVFALQPAGAHQQL